LGGPTSKGRRRRKGEERGGKDGRGGKGKEREGA